MKINEAVKTDINNSVLCWLATVDANQIPNVTPKEIFASHGEDSIVIADIASSDSVRNVRAHSQVCVSFVDVFRQKGFKIIGRANIIEPTNSIFPDLGSELLRMAGANFHIRNIISVHIEKISRIWAPSYKVFPDRSEKERMQSAYNSYGVQPNEPASTKVQPAIISHTTIGVSDVQIAQRFYNPLLATLGLVLKFADQKWAGWKHPDAERPLFIISCPFDGKPASTGNGQMIALLAAKRSQVDECYSLALSQGGSDEGRPNLRPEYHTNYYGAYFRDLDGNKVCVCCHNGE